MDQLSYTPFKQSHNLDSSSGLKKRHMNTSGVLVSKEYDSSSASRASTLLGDAKSKSKERKIGHFMLALWQFYRPHTVYGTVLAFTAIATRTWIQNADMLNWSIVLKTFFGLLSIICAHGYIVGINQIYDVEIDKLNKPYLPVASGDFSLHLAWSLVTMFAVTGILIVWILNYGFFMVFLYSLFLLMGTLYSVPPFRMKRFPVAAFLIISSVRGFLLNYTANYAIRTTLGLPSGWSLPLVFITITSTVFALAISILKDLPDVEGDRKFNIPTFATNFGVRNMALLGSTLLLLNYVGAITAAILIHQVFRRNFMILVHFILSSSLIFQAWALEQKNYTKKWVDDAHFLNLVIYLIPTTFIRKLLKGSCNSILSIRMEAFLH